MAAASEAGFGPRKRRHFSYDEEVDEAGKLIDRQSADIEREAAADGTEPVEQIDKTDKREPPGFEE